MNRISLKLHPEVQSKACSGYITKDPLFILLTVLFSSLFYPPHWFILSNLDNPFSIHTLLNPCYCKRPDLPFGTLTVVMYLFQHIQITYNLLSDKHVPASCSNLISNDGTVFLYFTPAALDFLIYPQISLFYFNARPLSPGFPPQ